jgi:uncharacterized damage-inducible protein DinB
MSVPNGSPMQLLFADLPNELNATRRTLARVPDGKNDWKPDEKSAPLGRLATHLAELPRLGTLVLTTDELDWAKQPYVPTALEITADRLATFDELASALQTHLAAADWDTLAKEWTMRQGDQVFMKSPKGLFIRSAGISHMTHHRAQLGVYLRLLGVPLPRIYGPSADEPM